MTKKIVILFSGSGTNLENIIKTLHKKSFDSTTIEIAGLICNNPNAKGIEKALKYDIKTDVINHKDFSSRHEFDTKLVSKINEFKPDLVVLAGFMRILSPIFTDNIKAINLHPSILPLFKGDKAIIESWNSDMRVAGISVHYVSSELDGGKIIDQLSFHKNETKTYEAYEDKIHSLEYELLPKVIINLLSKTF